MSVKVVFRIAETLNGEMKVTDIQEVALELIPRMGEQVVLNPSNVAEVKYVVEQVMYHVIGNDLNYISIELDKTDDGDVALEALPPEDKLVP